MRKRSHEFRDPVHVFIRLDPDERKVVDSEPFQRLRHIHQLAMTYLVYPGATHRRFEHSLGVMELATHIFDVLTGHTVNLPQEVLDRIPELIDSNSRHWWRKNLRFAALCHDLGHLPFSHAAENLLPENVSHETLTKRFILEGMRDIWASMTQPLPDPKLIAKLAVGPKEAKELGPFSAWERILSEVITGDVFGADRIDYLLRDSLHAGVSYGHFDHHRLIDTMRILPGTAKDDQEEYNPEPDLGIELGGLQVAESLLVARYLMFSQVYFHPVRRIYDLHLKAFLEQTLPNGVYPTDLQHFLPITDNDILVSIRKFAMDTGRPASNHARCIEKRRHFKKAYQSTSQDCQRSPDILFAVANGLAKVFGDENVMYDDLGKETSSKSDFPIRTDDGRIISAHGESKVMTSLPMATTGYVFVEPEVRGKACAWVKENLQTLLANKGGASCSTQNGQP
jgi:uncharacterized protein